MENHALCVDRVCIEYCSIVLHHYTVLILVFFIPNTRTLSRLWRQLQQERWEGQKNQGEHKEEEEEKQRIEGDSTEEDEEKQRLEGEQGDSTKVEKEEKEGTESLIN